MGIFSSSKNENELALVFDIGSSSVGGAIFEIHKSGIPKIIYSVREPINLEEKIDFERFLFLTLKSLESVASRICMMGKGAPKKIFCVLSSPWYASQTRHIKLEKNTSFVFSAKLADELTQKEISLIKEEHILKYVNTPNEIRPIEFKNMRVVLNGYTTEDPFDKKARELDMTVFVSMASEQILKKIEEKVSRHFNCKDIKFSSFAMASFVIARDVFSLEKDFLLIDIGGEVTDISVIKKEILSDSVSFPLGCNFIIRGVLNDLNCTPPEAKSLVSLYKDGHAGVSIEKKVGPVMDKLKGQWIKSFQESLVKLSNEISIPSTIFVTVEEELIDFFGQIIRDEQFTQYTLTDSKFKIVFLNTEILHNIANFKENVNRDPFIIIDTAYINRFI